MPLGWDNTPYAFARSSVLDAVGQISSAAQAPLAEEALYDAQIGVLYSAVINAPRSAAATRRISFLARDPLEAPGLASLAHRRETAART